jgi:high affinity Mn2+ porin
MRYVAPSAIIGMALLASAVAAEAPAEPANQSDFSWAGFHIGANFGAGIPLGAGERLRAGSGFTTNAFDFHPGSHDHSGVSFGAQLGYDWQMGQWVYGIETDFNLLDTRHGPSGLFPTPPAYWPLGVTAYRLESEPSGDYFASIRGRLGFALDRTLFYVTGGVVAGGWRGASRLTLLNPAPTSVFLAPVSQSSRVKYAVGGGVEYALDSAWSTRFEYLFVDQALQNQIYDDGLSNQYFMQRGSAAHLLRFGLNYRFSNDPPPDEKKSDEKTKITKSSDEKSNEAKNTPEQYSVHGQITGVVQGYPKFPALYSGPNSLSAQGQARGGAIANLFAGVKLWEGGSVFLNPEIDQGYQLSNTLGAAASVGGAATSVGRAAPYMRFQRYFLRQIIGLDGNEKQNDPGEGAFNETLESAQNQLAGKVAKDRITLTIGKFAVPDIFDDNVYAHDPFTGFMNNAVNSMGAFDYAQDTWGYTYGAALEWKQNWWTARAGIFQLSQAPTGPIIEPVLLRQFMGVTEFEARYQLFDQPGAIKFLAFGDNGYLSKIDDVVDLAYATGNLPPAVDSSRKRHFKTGGGVNIKQQLMPNLGFFLRASMTDGRYETVGFTDIDRSLSFGLVAAGALWDRPKDEIGAAVVLSGLSGSRVRYFASGGLSTHIGDGALSYSGEHVFESYYKLNVRDGVELTADYQFLHNPAYNLDRGPVHIFGLRLHAEF